MAKKRYSKRRERIPVIDTLLDLAQAATLDYVAHKMRQKNGGKRSKIDPYAATGFAMGMGMIEDTEDLLKFGGMLGVMGAFDDDDEEYDYTSPSSHRTYKTDINMFKSNDNRYAWRMNCEDGSAYGIYPEQYETKAEYIVALKRVKSNDDISEPTEDVIVTKTQENEYQSEHQKIYTYCKISRIDNGKNDYFLSGDLTLRVGDFVKVPTEVGQSNAIIIQIIECGSDDLPKPLEETQTIIEKMF